MGSDFVYVVVDESLGSDAGTFGGTFKGHEGDIHDFDCPGLDLERTDGLYLVYGRGMNHLQLFRLNGHTKWIERVPYPESASAAKASELRAGIIYAGELKEEGNTLQVYSNPDHLGDDFLVSGILIFYHTHPGKTLA